MKTLLMVGMILCGSLGARAGETHSSVNCFTSGGDIYLSIPSSEIASAKRYSSESVNYTVELKNGNTIYLPAANCVLEDFEGAPVLQKFLKSKSTSNSISE